MSRASDVQRSSGTANGSYSVFLLPHAGVDLQHAYDACAVVLREAHRQYDWNAVLQLPVW